MPVTFHPYLRKRGKDYTYGTVYIRVTIERKHIYCSTDLIAQAKDWDLKRKRFRSTCPNFEEHNGVLMLELAHVQKKYLDHRLAGRPITYDELAVLYSPKERSKLTLTHLIDEYCTVKQVGTSRKVQYLCFVEVSTEMGLPQIVVACTEQHAINFLNKLHKQDYKKNTIIGMLKKAKALYTYAAEKKLIAVSPFSKIKSGEWESNKKFLEESDIEKIANCYQYLEPLQQQVSLLFLFACYTGPRFTDLIKLKRDNIIQTPNGPALHYFISKTRKQNTVPLIQQAIDLLPLINWMNISNAYFNKILKEIAAVAHIEKHLTSHIARHTFATVGINKGIRLDAMQKFLGHTQIKTTQIYAHLSNSTLADEIKLMNKKRPARPGDFIHDALKADGAENGG